MSHYDKILVGVDLHHGDRAASKQFGPESHAAIQQALELAEHAGGAVTFCTVLDISPQAATLIERDHQHLLRTVEDIAAEMLDAEVAAARARGIAAERLVRIGSAWEELAKETAHGRYDLVVMGTRRPMSALRHLFGSTSQKVTRCAACPVWIVKPEELREIREIVVATDLSDASLPVLHAGIAAARAMNARLYILHVLEMDQIPHLLIAGVTEEEIATCQQRLREEASTKLNQQLVQTDYRTLPHGLKIEIITGSPDTAIGEFVAANRVDLLVMGTHGRRGVEGFLLGNTVERILPSLHASLLTVKPDNFVNPYAKP